MKVALIREVAVRERDRPGSRVTSPGSVVSTQLAPALEPAVTTRDPEPELPS